MNIRVKRVYKKSSAEDGKRILVDRLWPRGLSKEKMHIDDWCKDISPSTDLRKWYNHDPDKWEEFKIRYFSELESNQKQVKEFYQSLGNSKVTFLFSSKEPNLNNAYALKEFIEKKFKPAKKHNRARSRTTTD